MKQIKIQASLKVAVALVFLMLVIPISGGAHTTEDNSVLDETLAELRAEINSLRSEVRSLRAQVDGNQSPTFDIPEAVVLRSGDIGDNARELQEVLIYLGYDIPAGATGNFFSQTENALRSFQLDEGLTQSGIFDAATYEAFENRIEPPVTTTPVSVIPESEPSEPPSVPNEPDVPEIPEEEEPDVPEEIVPPRPNQEHFDFYTSAEFTACMVAHSEAVELIGIWVDQGLFPYEFPYEQISVAAQNAIVECENEQGRFYEPTYIDCITFSDESSCSAETSCRWFDTFCGDKDYDPLTGGGLCVGTTEESCTSVENCHWYLGSTETEPYSCFYPDATINGEAPGYTVWCEYDYQNCRQGDRSGAEVSLDELLLGAPSSCESGLGSSGDDSPYCYYDATGGPTTSASDKSFVASVVDSFAEALQSVQEMLSR